MNRGRRSAVRSAGSRGVLVGVVLRRRFVFGALVVAVALVVSGCGSFFEGFGDKDAESCDCPTLEGTVASIDWTGDGREPDEIEQFVGQLNRFVLRTSVEYQVVDPTRSAQLLDYVTSKMSAAGYEPVEARPRVSATYEGEDWWLHVTDSRVTTRLLIVVGTIGPDEKTPEYLAPLVDVFGTR